VYDLLQYVIQVFVSTCFKHQYVPAIQVFFLFLQSRATPSQTLPSRGRLVCRPLRVAADAAAPESSMGVWWPQEEARGAGERQAEERAEATGVINIKLILNDLIMSTTPIQQHPTTLQPGRCPVSLSTPPCSEQAYVALVLGLIHIHAEMLGFQ